MKTFAKSELVESLRNSPVLFTDVTRCENVTNITLDDGIESGCIIRGMMGILNNFGVFTMCGIFNGSGDDAEYLYSVILLSNGDVYRIIK